MAGQKIIVEDVPEHEICACGTRAIIPKYTKIIIIENGKIEEGDEWGLFRLTDDGLDLYKVGAEVSAGIMSINILGKSAVEEIDRCKTLEEALQKKFKLSKEEAERTLIRSVRPK